MVQNQTDARAGGGRGGARDQRRADGRRRAPGHGAGNDRVEVRFPAVRGGGGDGAVPGGGGRRAGGPTPSEVTLPVWTPATTEAFATYGQIDEGVGAAAGGAARGASCREFGGLEITTSSTALHALTDAVLYLVAYPFECAEQLASRVLAMAALRDVLAAFKAEGLPPAAEIEAAMARDLARLGVVAERRRRVRVLAAGRRVVAVREHPRGPRARPGESQGLHGAGADAGAARSTYLKGIDRHIPSTYGDEARRTLVAYALHVRALARRPGRGARAAAHPRSDAAEALVRGDRLAAGRVERRRRLGWRGGGDPAAALQPGHRDGWRGALRGAVRRRRLPAAALGPAGRRGDARGAHRDAAEERPHSRSSSRDCWRTARRAGGRTPRRTPSCCWRSTGTSGPTKPSRPTSWRACGWAIGSPVSSAFHGRSTDRAHLEIPMSGARPARRRPA